ncbi:MAG: YgjV family protein [Tenericutes bacterium]|nr:YgjV family protein [Mycoplasmatota bacterium]
MFYEYLGYAASITILVSILMSSPRKFRWINLLGGVAYAVYGILIDSIPVALLNFSTVLINLYYLYKMYKTSDYFKTLPIDKNSVYLDNFLDYYKEDIAKFFDTSTIEIDKSDISFYILRNVVPAGLFVGSKVNDNTLRIDFDYVVPIYRDFQMGEYIFKHNKEIFSKKGITSLITYTNSEKHENYLKKMGFNQIQDEENELKCFKLEI